MENDILHHGSSGHEVFMHRCFDLALRGAGRVSPNPMVGAVLVANDRIIGEGWHQVWGGPHAEVNCLQSVLPENQHLIPYSTLYCSLEPCSHHGKTPPCADLILEHKVPRVVVSNTDPNPLVAGKGLGKLRAAGVDVTAGVLEMDGWWLNRVFFTWITKKRPYIILKWAESADGFIAEKNKRTAISGPETQRLVHRWRSESDAILVGANTARIDNPRLDARFFGGNNPLRILLDGQGSVPINHHLLSDDAPTLIFGPERPGTGAIKRATPVDGHATVGQIIEHLYQENCASLLVEGGAMVLQQFIDTGAWDEIRRIQSTRQLRDGVKAPLIPAGSTARDRFKLGADYISVLTPFAAL